MATLLQAPSPGCDVRSTDTEVNVGRVRSGQQLWLRHSPLALLALATSSLAGCGNSIADQGASKPTPDAGSPSVEGSSTATLPSGESGDETATSAPTQSTASNTNQSSKPTAPNTSSTSSITTATSDTKPAATTTVEDLPPPSPEIFAPEGSNIPPGSGPLGVETTCDGKDDDENGVVDDVDATGDGVCDCLKVATLGLHGEWGDGDFVTGWLQDHVAAAATDLDGEPLAADRLAPFHILLIRDVSLNHNASLSFSAQEASELWTWVRNGGGLMTVIGYSDPDESGNVNSLLEPFGLSYASDQIVQGMGASVPVTEWFEHPLSAGITQVGADNGYPVAGAGITFAAQDDYDVGKALTIGDGHVLVWGDEWVTYEGEWASDTSYQVDKFWKNALLWLTRATQCKVNPT